MMQSDSCIPAMLSTSTCKIYSTTKGGLVKLMAVGDQVLGSTSGRVAAG